MYIKRIVVAIFIIGLLFLGGFSYYIYNAIMAPNTKFENEFQEVFIASDDSYNDVILQLRPLLEDISTFHKVAERKGYASNVKPGKFQLKRGMNNNDIINALRSKNIPVRISFNNQDFPSLLASRIATQIEADSISLVKAITDEEFLAENGLTKVQAMSIYIPNTYEMYWNTSAEQFRIRMLSEYRKFWTEERIQKAKLQNLSPEEVLVLASIVQKETSQVVERPRVAGVYLNRLKRGMKLQADPTVIFALKDKEQKQDTIIRRVLLKDLQIDSPYNTYMYAGLPPGIIGMPDITSIDAVLDPEKHNYLYFVADVTKPGFHKFSTTLAQHNRYANEYRAWVNKQKIYR
jgi:UPF0755 protein